MGRAPRIEYPGAIYHAMSRGVNRRATFRDDSDRTTFLTLLGKIVRKGALVVHAFCLMDNHFHLLLETPLGQLRRWMQSLLGDYAQRFNLRHGRVGHLWQGRFKGLLVEDGEYFLESSRYIHLNPPVRPAELWPWSSYRAYTGAPCAVDWVCTEKTLSHFAGREDYRAFVESKANERQINPAVRAKAGFILGGEDFVESAKRRIQESSHLEADRVLRALARKHPGIGFDEIRAAVELIFGDFSACQKRRVHAYALRSLTHARVAEIAAEIGLSASAVSHAVRSVNVRLERQSDLRQRVLELRDFLA